MCLLFTYRFIVNLQHNQDVSFHFDPRWNSQGSSVPLVTYNYKVNGVWGSEQRKSVPFPFAKGYSFKLHYTCDTTNWYLAVNDVHYLTFAHHVDFNLIDKIYIYGNVAIASVNQYYKL